ncbi:MAG: hypothetical protein ACYCQJ_09655 [Nitrososphaerales archaeon]
MHTGRLALLAFAILFLLIAPMAFAQGSPANAKVLANSSYKENLSFYLTSAQTLWKADLSGGNISLGLQSIPSSVSSFTLSLTHYNTWTSQFEVFTKYGFGYLGSNEPMPNATILTVDTTSLSDASSLANEIGSKYALVFLPYSSNSSSFTFVSPSDFTTEIHNYFWNLLPASAGGFAKMMTEQQFESGGLVFFTVTFAGSSYSISYGSTSPAPNSAKFNLENELGVSGPINYSSVAVSSDVQVHVLGGLVISSNSTYTNHDQNFSALISTVSPGSGRVPNINATLDFSFPTIVAYRQISSLVPAINSAITVSITIQNISPAGTPPANVSVTDNWFTSDGFTLTGAGSATASFSLSPGTTNVTSYGLKTPSTAGAFLVPSTAVTYSFTAANHTLSAQALLNSEEIYVGSSTAPSLEAIEKTTTSTISQGQSFPLNIELKNLGSSAAFNVTAAGQRIQSIPALQSANVSVTASSASLVQTNASVVYQVSWQNATKATTAISTNTISAIYSFGSPGSPSTGLSKSVAISSSKSKANVTLVLSNTGTDTLNNLTIVDSIPSGMSFVSSSGNFSLSSSNGTIRGFVSSLVAGATVNSTYILSISNSNQNYVFLPANVSATWNNLVIVHYSQGAGEALGVSAFKSISPNAGFQGSNVTEELGIQNKGTLPVYLVSLSNTADSFLSALNSSSKSTPVLNSGQSINTTLDANLTGTAGTYNSSSSAATFVFAGTNVTASSNVFTVTIYKDLSSSMSVTSPRIEENHNIQITVTISNPSNVTVTNVNYVNSLPANLNQVQGAPSFSVSSLGPNQNTTHTFEFATTIPEQYTINGGNLTFQYQGRTLKGQTSPLSLNIVDDILTRYAIPVVIGLVVVLATLLYVRRLIRK